MNEADKMANEVINSSIRINAKLWEDFKIWCIKNKISMSEKLEEVIKEIMKDGK